HLSATNIYTLSLHDALPIYQNPRGEGDERPHRVHRALAAQDQKGLLFQAAHDACQGGIQGYTEGQKNGQRTQVFHIFSSRVLDGDRKSTRLNSSHVSISYAV